MRIGEGMALRRKKDTLKRLVWASKGQVKGNKTPSDARGTSKENHNCLTIRHK